MLAKSIPLLLFLVSLPIAPLAAQSVYQAPHLKTEVFGGFSTAPVSPGRADGKALDGVRLNGWAASITSYHFFRRWGLAAELAGQSRNREGLDVSTQSFLFGGTYRSFEKRRFALTGRILAGAGRWNPTVLPPNVYQAQSHFTFGFGQSIDIKITERLAIRIQPDLAFVRRAAPEGETKFDLTTPLSFGAVLKFGSR